MIEAAVYRILYCLSDKGAQSLDELCGSAGYTAELSRYYIQRLTHSGHVEEAEPGRYALTTKGRQHITQPSTNTPFAARPRLAVLLVPRQGDSYLVIKRGRQPFMGTAEWPMGAVRLGEPIANAAGRVLQGQLQISGEPNLLGFFRRIECYLDTGMSFDDRLLAIYTVRVAPGQQAVAQAPHKLQVHTAADLITLPRPSRSLLDVWKFSQEPVPYREHTYVLDASDLGM